MKSRDEQFFPEAVDEQVEQLVHEQQQQSGSVLPGARLIRDLQAIYGEHAHVSDSPDLQAAHDRVWKRLRARMNSENARSGAAANTQPTHEQILHYERHRYMKQEGLYPKRSAGQRLGMIAAVLFAMLLVGSMVWMFTAARHSGTGTASPNVGMTNRSAQQQAQNNTLPASTPSGIYAGDENDIVRVDTRNGKIVWRYNLPAASYSGALSVSRVVAVNDTVYAAVTSFTQNLNSSVLALNAENGKLRWSYEITGDGLDTMDLAVSDGTLYVGTGGYSKSAEKKVYTKQDTKRPGPPADGMLYAFDPATGAVHATYHLTGVAVNNIAVVKGIVYASASDGLHAINLEEGKQLWFAPIKLDNTTPHVIDGVVYTVITHDTKTNSTQSYIAAFDANTGNKLWQTDWLQGQAFDLTVANNAVYVGILQGGTVFRGKLYAYDTHQGNLLWEKTVQGSVQWAPSVANGVVYVSAFPALKMPEEVVAFNTADGSQKWTAQVAAGVMTTPYVGKGVIYVASGPNLYGLNASDGAQLWKISLDDAPEAIAVVA
jgi:outer membrane protein assembly factor BamB